MEGPPLNKITGKFDLYYRNITADTHDANYIKYLKATFGTTSVPFFGALICIVTFLLIIMLLMINSALVFVSPTETPIAMIGPSISLDKPVIL